MQTVENEMAMDAKFYSGGKGLKSKKWAFEPLLFMSLKFVDNQFPAGEYVSFTLEKEEEVHAILHFTEVADTLISLPRSPFGGISASPAVGQNDLQMLIDAVLSKAGARPVKVFLPYSGYPSSGAGMFADTLQKTGFEVAFQDTHQFVPVSVQVPLKEAMHESQIRRLAKCEKAGFIFQEESLEQLEEVYAFIKACRLEQQIPLNMALDVLVQSVERLKGVYRAFTVRDNKHIVAACITVDVSKDVLYYFLPAASPDYNTYSPMVMLLHGLYGWARLQGFSVLDLGKSSVKGVPQKGLMSFKEKMGASSGLSPCMTFTPLSNRQ